MSIVNLHHFFDRASLHILNVSVSDGVYSGRTRVRVALASANSFAPVFPDDDDDLSVEFEENRPEGSLVAVVAAVDGDRDDHVTYAIQSDALAKIFSVHPSSGEVRALKVLDREDTASYEIPLVATDRGGLSGHAILKVKVTDENDNPPVFDLAEYKANVFANATVGSEVLRVSAADADLGPNAELTYSIYEEAEEDSVTRVFSIDPATGTIELISGV